MHPQIFLPAPNANATGHYSTKKQKVRVDGGAQFAGASSNANFTWQHGQVLNNPQFYNVFIGNWSSVADQERMKRLNQFMIDLLASEWMSTLKQYGCTNPGKFVKGIVIAKPKIATASQNDSDIEKVIQAAIDDKILPEPTGLDNNNVYFLYLDDNTSIQDSALGVTMCAPAGNNSFGYHHYFITNKNNQCYYSVIPGLSDACIKATCGPTAQGCSLGFDISREQRQTQVVSHEVAEVISNPESNGGWYDINTGMEIGDVCNGAPVEIIAGANKWMAQEIYSKANGACVTSSDAKANALNIFLQNDIYNKYNLLGGGLGLMAGAVLAGITKTGFGGLAAYSLFGFAAGFAATDFGKKYVDRSTANKIKTTLTQIGL